jgi:hypothetical protein
MKSSSLQGKTVRPDLMAYSFYRSDRHPMSRRVAAVKPRPKVKINYGRWLMLALIVATGVLVFNFASKAFQSSGQQQPSSAPAVAAAEGPKQCSGNSLSKAVIVSVSERHMWACQLHKVVYDSPVVTGIEKYPATLTPRGTYHIASKQTETKLTGSDAAGSWDVNVHYWMPFLQNQHGVYGFHDATWRPNSEFGNINPNSGKASHGCVELPLNASHWLYSWAAVGTTVTVKN